LRTKQLVANRNGRSVWATVAESGSWTHSKRAGYRVMLARLNDGESVSYELISRKLYRTGYQPTTMNNTVIYE